MSFLSQFPDDDACWAHLEAVRWPAGAICVECGSIGEATALKSRPHYWQCRACRTVFTVAMGTPIEGTHLPMRTWFTALFLVTASSKGISSVKLGEHLGIGQKTAWFLGQRIRRMMESQDGLLSGIVEVDETYLGGKKRPKGQTSKRDDDDQPIGRSGSRKSMVTVATERGGRARAAKGRTHSGRTIANFVNGHVDRTGTVLVSDELPAYRWIGRKFPAHLRVNHSKGEYVRYDRHAAATAHTNTAETFNATLKRAWVGVFHWFSIKHTDRYLHEITFRWNARKQGANARLAGLFVGTSARLRWKDLVA